MHRRQNDPDGHVVTFGSASLLEDSIDVAEARAVLNIAIDAGAQRLDVAPMYGHGATEPIVLALGAERGVPVTTKVGIEPRPPRPRWHRMAVGGLERMPRSVRAAVRRAGGAAGGDPFAPSGRFGVDAVRGSLERSLRVTGRLDRVLLHEVQPPDVTDELLELLVGYRDRGDVVELGCATRNVITRPVLNRAAGMLTVAHVSTAPLGDPVPTVPPDVRVVGHGAFGAGGGDLRRLSTLLRNDVDLAASWTLTVAGTSFDGEGGLVRALLARARAEVPELLVATTRPERARNLVRDAAAPSTLDAAATAVLGRAVAQARNDPGEGARHAG